jgi:hypothetical protein
MVKTKQIDVAANIKSILDAANYAAVRTLLNVENGADVTDAANVAAAGALMKSGGTMTGAIVTADHGTATSPQVVSVVYGTGSPPTASTTPIGTIFVQYTA